MHLHMLSMRLADDSTTYIYIYIYIYVYKDIHMGSLDDYLYILICQGASIKIAINVLRQFLKILKYSTPRQTKFYWCRYDTFV